MPRKDADFTILNNGVKQDSITAIVKPTHECNLACRYCYIGKEAEEGRMKEGTLAKMTQDLASLGVGRVQIIWHGGEPLLMGLDFYRDAIKMQKRFGDDVLFGNSMQSNGTLIDGNTIEFCEEYYVDIGTSMDGPEEVHNLTRVYPDGRGSFHDVYRGTKLLRERTKVLQNRHPLIRDEKLANGYGKERGCLSVGGGTITVVTRANIGGLKEIYIFFKEEDINMKLNPLIRAGLAGTNFDNLAIGSAEYGKALAELFDVWFYEKEPTVSIDPFEEILGNLMTRRPRGCNFLRSCRENFVSIGPQGDIYPCGRFDGTREYWLGNIHKTPLAEAMTSERNTRLAERGAETVRGCAPCDYRHICNAGCMHNAYMVRGRPEDKDYYCQSYKILFRHLESALHRELAKAEMAGM